MPEPNPESCIKMCRKKVALWDRFTKFGVLSLRAADASKCFKCSVVGFLFQEFIPGIYLSPPNKGIRIPF